uniref:sulfate transport system permease protein n=1 Tax=Galdieria phlegrea TaxID=1389228 RepID=UPI0023D7E4EB|nr:sulfate transport system permease protein [Galdieria phlegrea]WDA99833.1 sulfate transport system permease protein [Galdieria phlegrea]
MTKYFILIISLIYLSFFIFLPLLTLLLEIFSNGILVLLCTYLDENLLYALGLTFYTVFVIIPFNSLIGLWIAWILTHYKFFGRKFLLFILDIPLTLSPIILGLMIVLLYSKHSYLGSILLKLGIQITYHFLGILLTVQFITLPLIPKQVIPILLTINKQEEEAAKILGANSWQVFWLIVFPYIKSAFLSGTILNTARIIGEFGAVLIVSGNLIGKTQTLTLFLEQSYKEYQTYISNAIALLLILLSLFFLYCRKYLLL